MNRRGVVTAALVVAGCLALSVRTDAILGIGDIVFDPSVYGQAVEQVIHLEQQYAQLVQSYLMLRNQYEQLVFNATQVPVNMAARYRAVLTPWRLPAATDTYGVNGGWMTAITSGQNVAAGYGQSTEALRAYGAGLGNVPGDQLGHVKDSYATVELTDGAAQGTLETIGRLRANAGPVQMAIQGLENDSLSGAPGMNSEVAVLNKINAANVISLRSAQDTNKLLVGLAEGQLLTEKRTRDAEARAINQHIRFMNEGGAVLTAQAAGASDAMLNWRMP